ncbi:hypothetical protein HYH02_011045 [Chlamydomonas schloesseri]|uniref:Guanylate cyclase domain-containing protein n=1 Tax=Chlamydomonas schloesseri TaxID=2026947 RepID=A0A835T2J5_9CHLO|nr:hypothetical protein HYH02_011045 [Chlamydomonas schloesseri]|eukprot:KAG2437664.1 hypothetical protein HYH02_011045 [Chlamydomonas schloesseri]
MGDTADGGTPGGRLHEKLLRRVQATYSGSDSVRLTARHLNRPATSLLGCGSAAAYQALLAALVRDDALLLAALRESCKAVLEGQPAATAATAATALAGGVISGGDGAPVMVVGHPPTGPERGQAVAELVGTVHKPARVPLPVSLLPLIVSKPPKPWGTGGQSAAAASLPAPPAVAVVVLYPLSRVGLGGLHQALQRGYAVLAQLPGLVTLLASAQAPPQLLSRASGSYLVSAGLAADPGAPAGLAGLAAGAEPAWDAAHGSGSVRHSAGRAGTLLGVGEVLFQNAASVNYFGLRRSAAAALPGAAGAGPRGAAGAGSGGGGGGSRLLAELFELAPEGQLEEMLKQVTGGRTWRGILPVRAQLSADVTSMLESFVPSQQQEHLYEQPPQQQGHSPQQLGQGRPAVAVETETAAVTERAGSAATGMDAPCVPPTPLPQEAGSAAAAGSAGSGDAASTAEVAAAGRSGNALAGFGLSAAGPSFGRSRREPLPPPSGAVMSAMAGPAAAEAEQLGSNRTAGCEAGAGVRLDVAHDSGDVPPLILLHTAHSGVRMSTEVAEVSDAEREAAGGAGRERGSRTSATASVAGSAAGVSGARARGFSGFSLPASRKVSLAGTSSDAAGVAGAGAPPPRRSYGGAAVAGLGGGWHARVWSRSRSSHSNRAKTDGPVALGTPSGGADSGGHAGPKRAPSGVGSEAHQVESTSASMAGSAPNAGSFLSRLFTSTGAGAWLSSNSPQRAGAGGGRPASATTAAPGGAGRGGGGADPQPKSQSYARLGAEHDRLASAELPGRAVYATGMAAVDISAASNTNTGGGSGSGNAPAAFAAASGSGQHHQHTGAAGGPAGPLLSCTRPVTRRRIQFASAAGPLASSLDAAEAPLSTSTWGLLGTVRKMDGVNVNTPNTTRSSVTAVTAAAAAAAVAAASAQQASGTGAGAAASGQLQLSGGVAAVNNGSSSRCAVARSRSDAATSGTAVAAAAAAVALPGLNISDHSDQLLPLPPSSSYMGAAGTTVGVVGFESATGTDTHGTDNSDVEHIMSAGVGVGLAHTGSGAVRSNARSFLPLSAAVAGAGAGGGGGGGVGGFTTTVSGRVRSSLASREPSARFLSIVAAAAAGSGAGAGVSMSSRGGRNGNSSNRRASLSLSPAAAAAAAAAAASALPSGSLALRARSCVGMTALMDTNTPGSLAAAGGTAAAAASTAAVATADVSGAAAQGYAAHTGTESDRASSVDLGGARRGGVMEAVCSSSDQRSGLLPPPPVAARSQRAASMPINVPGRAGALGILRLAAAAAAAVAGGVPPPHTRTSTTTSISTASSLPNPQPGQKQHRLRTSSQEWAQREGRGRGGPGAGAAMDAPGAEASAHEARAPAAGYPPDAMASLEAALARCRYVSDGGHEVEQAQPQRVEQEQPQQGRPRVLQPPPLRSGSSRRRISRNGGSLLPSGRNVAGTQADDEAEDTAALGQEQQQRGRQQPQQREVDGEEGVQTRQQQQQQQQVPRRPRSRTPRSSSTDTTTAAAAAAAAAAATATAADADADADADAAAAAGTSNSRANSNSSHHVLITSDRDTPGAGQQTSSDVPQAGTGWALPPRAGAGPMPPSPVDTRGGGGGVGVGGPAGALGLRPAFRAYAGPSLSPAHSHPASAVPGASGSGRGGARTRAAAEGGELGQLGIEEEGEGQEQVPSRRAGGAGGGGQAAAAAAAAASVGCSWQEVTASQMVDPTTGQPALLLVGVDVTARVRAERQIAEVLDAEHRLLESIFPRHVLEVAAARQQQQLQREAAAAAGMGGGRGGRMAGLGMAGLLLTADCASLATYHPLVTILFADIIGFTEMCHSVPATAVMTFLNQLYSRLDTLLDVYGVYKVETIGDCYMVAGGLMTRDEEGFTVVRGPDAPVDSLHAHKAMAFAKAMLREAAQVLLPTTGRPVQMRIGLHSGPVMSGIVGSKMPRFCLFGDTVNTASRMESTCKPGCIHVSAATRQCLHSANMAAEDEEDEDEEEDEDGEWRPTGGVQVKGKGLMHTYTWRARASAAAGAVMAGGGLLLGPAAAAAAADGQAASQLHYNLPPSYAHRSARASVPGLGLGSHTGLGLGDTGDTSGMAGGGGGGTISGAPHGVAAAAAAVRRARRASAVTYCHSPGGGVYGGGTYRAGGGVSAVGMPYDVNGSPTALPHGGGGGGLGSGGMRRAPRRSRASLRRSSLVLLGTPHNNLVPSPARGDPAAAGLDAPTDQSRAVSPAPPSPGSRRVPPPPPQQLPHATAGPGLGSPVPRRASSLQPIGFAQALQQHHHQQHHHQQHHHHHQQQQQQQQQHHHHQQHPHLDHLQYASRVPPAAGGPAATTTALMLLPARAASAVLPSGGAMPSAAPAGDASANTPAATAAATAAASTAGTFAAEFGREGVGPMVSRPHSPVPIAAVRGAVRRASSSSHLRPRRVRSFLAVKQPSPGAGAGAGAGVEAGLDLVAAAAAAAAATREAALSEAAAAGASGRLRSSGTVPAGFVASIVSGVVGAGAGVSSPGSTAHHSWAYPKSNATGTGEHAAMSGVVEPIKEEAQGGSGF